MASSSAKERLVTKEVVDDLVSGWLQSMTKGRQYTDPSFQLPELTPRAQAVGLGAEKSHSRLMTIMEPIDKKLKRGIMRDKQRDGDDLKKGIKRFRDEDDEGSEEGRSKAGSEKKLKLVHSKSENTSTPSVPAKTALDSEIKKKKKKKKKKNSIEQKEKSDS